MSTKIFIIGEFAILMLQEWLHPVVYDGIYSVSNLNTFEYELIYGLTPYLILFIIYFVSQFRKAMIYYFNNGKEVKNENKKIR